METPRRGLQVGDTIWIPVVVTEIEPKELELSVEMPGRREWQWFHYRDTVSWRKYPENNS